MWDPDALVGRLDRRWHALLAAPPQGTAGPMHAFKRWVESEPAFADAVVSLRAWHGDSVGKLQALVTQNTKWDVPIFADDAHEAGFGWQVLEHFGAPAQNDFAKSFGVFAVSRLLGPQRVALSGGPHRGYTTAVDRDVDAGVRQAIETFIGPTHRFLIEHIEMNATLLHHFERFATWSRWFGNTALLACANSQRANSRKKSNREANLCSYALEWVFRDGMAITDVEQQVQSAAGRMDFVVTIRGNRKVPIEAKLLGKFGRTKYSSTGLARYTSQLESYVGDLGTSGFLLIFHNYEREVVIQSAGTVSAASTGALTILDAGVGRRLGVILVRLLPPPTPSAGLPPIVISSAEILGS